MAADAMRMVRAEICRRLDLLERGLARRGTVGARAEAEAIVAICAEYGLGAALRVAEGLMVALGNGGRGAAVAPWIEKLRDAIDCEAADAGDTWLASIMVRLAG